MKVLTAVKMAHYLLQDKLAGTRLVVDATAGNGNDTLFLALNTPPDCRILAFDVQQDAITKTKQLLQVQGLVEKVQLILDSHVHITDYCPFPPDVIMFNLGYLPGGIHSITTTAETTVSAVQASLGILVTGGIITIAAYHGHSEGQRELETLRSFLERIPQETYTVACWQMINQKNRPPILYIIEKKG